MIKMKLICKKCGYKFEKKVFEKGEAEEKKTRSYPIRCPKCGGSVDKCM
jgi:DNA-directed RNA polymerase subunit RPC12/RpoP